MRKTCERPGCAETATVVFGMVPEDLLVWMEPIDPADPASARAGLLCTRHADSTGVPLGWSLDDRREQAPRLFRIPERPASPHRPGDATARLRRPRPEDWAMALFDEAPPPDGADDGPSITPELATPEPVTPEPITPEPITPDGPDAEEGRATERHLDAGPDVEDESPEPWRPRFDRSDDLGGLLQAQSPLLRRAFGVDD